jgi:hypothetical protein
MRPRRSAIDNAYRACLRSPSKTRFTDVIRCLWYLMTFRLTNRRATLFNKVDNLAMGPQSRRQLRSHCGEVASLIKAANIASLLYPGGQKCLDQAYTLSRLLASRGIHHNLCVGVTKIPPLAFHAWTQINGDVLSDDQEHIERRYVRMPIGALRAGGRQP